MKTTFIYALVDPRTNQIRYVGKSNNLKERLANHCNPARYRPTHKFNWIKKLRELGLKPYLIVLEEVELENWKFWEKFWIEQCKNWGFNLVNHTEGGDGLTYGNQTSFKKGHITWNSGTAKPKVLKGTRGKEPKSVVNHFKKDHVPWNKGKKSYKIGGKKKSIPVIQIDIETNLVIKTHLGCKEASEEMGCNMESIRNACVGKSKTSQGYKWKYEQ